MANHYVFHPDWRDWIASELRRKLKRERGRRPTRAYLMRSIDKFERFTSQLSINQERCFQLEDICLIANRDSDEEEWTPNSASRFLGYLADIGVISKRYAGRSGNGIKLLKALYRAPDPSRQGLALGSTQGSEQAHHEDPEKEKTTMTAPSATTLPEDTVELDGAAVLLAIDTVTERLGSIRLDFRGELSGSAAATAYDAQGIVSRAMSDLQRLRTAIMRGDGAPLLEILD